MASPLNAPRSRNVVLLLLFAMFVVVGGAWLTANAADVSTTTTRFGVAVSAAANGPGGGVLFAAGLSSRPDSHTYDGADNTSTSTRVRRSAVKIAWTLPPPGTGLNAEVLAASAGFVAADTAGDLATSCANSFTADTPVTLADGKQVPISKVKVGDKVLATDPQTGVTRAEPVVALIRHSGQHTMVLVTLADGSVLDATNGHKVWDATQHTFVDADQLAVGDKIETDTGGLITVAGLTTYSASLTAYNLQISTIHTYYAGTTPVLVHNSCDGLLGEATAIADHSNARALAGDGKHYVRGVHPDALGHYVDGVLEGKVPNLETRYGLSNGRTAYWDPGKGAVVFDDGAGGGSVFTPRDGYAYFEGLK